MAYSSTREALETFRIQLNSLSSLIITWWCSLIRISVWWCSSSLTRTILATSSKTTISKCSISIPINKISNAECTRVSTMKWGATSPMAVPATILTTPISMGRKIAAWEAPHPSGCQTKTSTKWNNLLVALDVALILKISISNNKIILLWSTPLSNSTTMGVLPLNMAVHLYPLCSQIPTDNHWRQLSLEWTHSSKNSWCLLILPQSTLTSVSLNITSS